MTQQRPNGWFENCCLTDDSQPLTHTLAYALRGLVEGYAHTKSPVYLESATITAEGMLGALRDDGFLPGRLDADWNGTVSWSCLTGSVQTAYCWFKIFEATGDARFRDAGYLANQFVRRTISLDGPENIRGGVKGSFPVNGDYGRFEYLNWACKFFIDAQLLEMDIRDSERGTR